jgi:hypothetical protein
VDGHTRSWEGDAVVLTSPPSPMIPDTPDVPEGFDLTTALGPIPESARTLAASADPGTAAAFVAEKCMDLVFPERVGDPMFVDAITRSAFDNVDAMWRIIAGRAPLDSTTPLGAFAFAETAADVGVPASQFERVYRVGTTLTWLAWYREARAFVERTGARLDELVEAPTLIIHSYLDALLTPTLERYDATRADTRRTRDQLKRSILRQALDGTPVLDEQEVAHALGVSTGGWFVAMVVRSARLDHTRVVDTAKRACESGTAIGYQHGPDTWVVWLWRAERFSPDVAQRLDRAFGGGATAIAASDAAAGPLGLSASGRDALEGSRLQALLGHDEGFLGFSEVRLEALLLQNPAEARRFATTELGQLGEDTPRVRRLRHTAMLWLSNGSHVATAAALHLHEHTVRNRIAQAEARLGAGLATRRTELLVALRLMRMLESAPDDPTRA